VNFYKQIAGNFFLKKKLKIIKKLKFYYSKEPPEAKEYYDNTNIK